MRTKLEFVSRAFPPAPADREINEGRYGRALADYLAEHLPRSGFAVEAPASEDWGWRLDLADGTGWIGCGNYEEMTDGFLLFIEEKRGWFRGTKLDVDRLADALERIVQASGAERVRWWEPGARW